MKTLLDYERQYRQAQQKYRKNDMLPVIPKAKIVTPQSASSNERKTIAEFDFNNKVIKLMKTNPIYTLDPIRFTDISAMYKQAWVVLHSPKLIGVTFIVDFYGNTIKSMVSFAEMNNLHIDIIVPHGKFHTSREYLVWYSEQATRDDNFKMSIENQKLIVKHCPELYKIAARSIEDLIEVLRSQIKLSGYDVSMYSIITTDGLNSGTIEDRQGKAKEWSRDYTKYYERYDQTLNDLLNMYISCKFYKKAGFAPDNTDGINRDDYDSYTSTHENIGSLTYAHPVELEELCWRVEHERYIDPHLYAGLPQLSERDFDFMYEYNEFLCTIYNTHIEEPAIPEREDTVVPRCACGLGLQNYMN